MKKLFTIDDFIVAFASAMGYGLGETIPKLLGLPELVCVAAGFAVAFVLEETVYRMVFNAYQDGAAAGIEFIIGIPGDERHVFRSFVGNQNYRDFISAAVADMKNYADGSIGDAVRKYTETQTASSAALEEKSKIVEQWIALNIYRSAEKLSEGGNKVHLMYWDEKSLIGNLGSGTVDAAAVLLGNREALQMYGNVMNADLSGILQSLLQKFICGKSLKLYPNEIKGVDAFAWEGFPQALIVSDGSIQCGKIEI